MKQCIILLAVILGSALPAAHAQEKKSGTDWDAAYERLLKNPEALEKIKAKGASKQQVIEWMKQRVKEKAGAGKQAPKSKSQKSNKDWDAAYAQLLKKDAGIRKKVENGDTTKEEVIAWMKSEVGAGKEKPGDDDEAKLSAFKKKLDELVVAGKFSKKQAAELYETMAGSTKKDAKSASSKTDWGKEYEELLKTNPSVKAKVQSGGATKEQVIAWLRTTRGAAADMKSKLGRGKAGGKRHDGSIGFYAIVIGRLKTKDVELGEFTFDVDHVTSMYGNRWVKDKLVGRTVSVTGVSGQFLDKLLLIKRDQPLKVRTGGYKEDKNQLTFGVKFQVLERTAPFEPAAFGIPPKEFRGFRGVLVGEVIEAEGYEVLMRVDDIAKTANNNAAKNAGSIKSKRVRVVGLYRHKETFDDLYQGDTIRVGVNHADPTHDELQATDLFEKVEK